MKTLCKVGIEGTYLNIIKAMYEKPTVNIILNGQKLKSFPSKIRNKTRMPSLTTPIQHRIGSPSHSNQTRKSNKRHPNWKGGNKTVIVCRWHDSVHRKSYTLHKKLVNLINEFGKTAGYKVNTQKSKAFLYTNNETSETEVSEKIPLDIAKRKIKYLGINLTKEVEVLFSENCTTLKKEIKEDTNKWKHVPRSWLEELTSSKWPYYPKWFIDSMQSLLEYPWHISQIWNKHFSNLYGTINDPE